MQTGGQITFVIILFRHWPNSYFEREDTPKIFRFSARTNKLSIVCTKRAEQKQHESFPEQCLHSALPYEVRSAARPFVHVVGFQQLLPALRLLGRSFKPGAQVTNFCFSSNKLLFLRHPSSLRLTGMNQTMTSANSGKCHVLFSYKLVRARNLGHCLDTRVNSGETFLSFPFRLWTHTLKMCERISVFLRCSRIRVAARHPQEPKKISSRKRVYEPFLHQTTTNGGSSKSFRTNGYRCKSLLLLRLLSSRPMISGSS